MKPTICVAFCTHNHDKHILRNLFNSLRELDPNEICIVDTSEKHDSYFEEWLYNQSQMAGAEVVKVRHIPDWDNNQTLIRNTLLELAESDWLVLLDSDEMVTIEFANDLDNKLSKLPPHVTGLRVKKINLIDDTHCLSHDIWQPKERLHIGTHPLIVKRGTGKFVSHPDYENKYNPIYLYEGRREIPLESPNHPCVDWHGYYIVHLWLYKDMPTKWQKEKWERKLKYEAVQKGDSKTYITGRGWQIVDLPQIANWREVTI